MTPLNPPGIAGSAYDTYAVATPDAADQWLLAREHDASARLRGPVLAAAQRIGLASARCVRLDEQLSNLRQQRLNPPAWADTSELWTLDNQIMQVESELHRERAACWKDLQPLLESARDAAIDQLRRSWISELARLVNTGDDS